MLRRSRRVHNFIFKIYSSTSVVANPIHTWSVGQDTMCFLSGNRMCLSSASSVNVVHA